MVVLEKEEGTTIDNNRASVNTRQWDDKASIMPLVDDVNGADGCGGDVEHSGGGGGDGQ